MIRHIWAALFLTAFLGTCTPVMAQDEMTTEEKIAAALEAAGVDPDRPIETEMEREDPGSPALIENAPARGASVLTPVVERGLPELVLRMVLAEFFDPAMEEDKSLETAEAELLAYVRPLPASLAHENWQGYLALSRIDPENALYATKAEQYRAAFEANRYAVLDKLKVSHDDFNGYTFYEHPSRPRYVDTRSFLQVYLAVKGERVSPRFYLNYTGDRWLFVQNAQVKIDGKIMDLPVSDWKRDNDSEIWEWVDVSMTLSLRDIAERIGQSQETIIRFNGRQYSENVIITQQDKTAILEMFAAEDALKRKFAEE